MAVNDTYHETGVDIAAGADFIIDGSSSATGAAEIHEFGGTGDADIYRETDVDGDGTFEVSILIDQVTNEWHSQQNQLTISSSENHRILINNTTSSQQDFFATGMEVND